MSFTLSRPAPGATRASRPSTGRRPNVVVRAQFLDDVGAGFARIFTPRGKDAPTTGAPYSGKTHRPHKPLSDVPYANVQASSGTEPAPQRPDEDSGVVGYVGKAAQQVVTGNFKGEDEPNAWSGEGKEGSTGWSSDIHSRHREGFHTVKAEVQAPRKAKDAPEAGPAAADKKEEEEGTNPVGNIVSFLGKAAQRLVAHNFTGDKTEPEQWKDKDQDSAGWKGDIHTRKREGFHSIKD